MIFLILILFGAATCKEVPNNCFLPGECVNSVAVNYTFIDDEFECMEFCHEVDACKWFTFSPKFNACFLFKNCGGIDVEKCPDCLSGMGDCKPPPPNCGVAGKCLGTVIRFVDGVGHSACLDLCKETSGCSWYTFNRLQPQCVLLSSCANLDQTDENYVSGEKRCKKASFKILVGIGYYNNSLHLDNVEVFDLASPNSICKPLPKFPHKTYFAGGGLGFQNRPTLCGGYPNLFECFTYADGSWNIDRSLSIARYGFAMSKSPFPNDGSQLFVTGGNLFQEAPLSSSEVLTENGWQLSAELPVPVVYHCMVNINSTAVMIIGGRQGSSQTVSAQSYIFNSDLKQWTEGPSLSKARWWHSCAAVNRDKLGSAQNIIVVGGEDASNVRLDSTEVLDDRSAVAWRAGPVLPFGLRSAALVEDPADGVVLVGGVSGAGVALDTIFRLTHVRDGAQWELLERKLETPRYAHTAFAVPDGITTCK